MKSFVFRMKTFEVSLETFVSRLDNFN